MARIYWSQNWARPTICKPPLSQNREKESSNQKIGVMLLLRPPKARRPKAKHAHFACSAMTIDFS